jgi:hypothetical protein
MMWQDSKKFCSSSDSFRSQDGRKVQVNLPAILAGLLAFMIPSLPAYLEAATVQATATLALRIEPAAALSARPITSSAAVFSALPGNGAAQTLVEIDIAIRIRPGATASLWLYPASDASGSQQMEATVLSDPLAGIEVTGSSLAPQQSQSLLTIHRSGQYSVIVGIPSSSAATPGRQCRLELKSSDNSIASSAVF